MIPIRLRLLCTKFEFRCLPLEPKSGLSDKLRSRRMQSSITQSLRKAEIRRPESGNGADTLSDDVQIARDLQGGELRLSPMDPATRSQLLKAGVELISCRECPALCDPQDEDVTGQDIYSAKALSAWSKQSIDLEGKMLGANKPFLRHALISTGKRDWPHDIASVKDSLAAWFAEFVEEKPAQEGTDESSDDLDAPQAVLTDEEPEPEPELPEGCWQTTAHKKSPLKAAHNPRPSRVLFGNASHVSASKHHHGQTVLLFPDYVAVADLCDGTGDKVPEEKQKTRRVFQDIICGPPLGDGRRKRAQCSTTARNAGVQRWALPYAAVIVLCSHRKRDARCGLAAPMLAEAFRRHAEAAGWEVDERGENIGHDTHRSAAMNAGVEFDDNNCAVGKGWGYIHENGDYSSTSEPCPDDQLHAWRRLAAASGRVTSSAGKEGSQSSEASWPTPPLSPLSPSPPSLLILYTSHIGKHAWSGNVIVYFPNGAGVWYARVDPVKGAAGRVWEQTIVKGKVIPEYLRAGINLYRGGSQSSSANDSDNKEEKVTGLGLSLLGTRSKQLRQASTGPGILRW